MGVLRKGGLEDVGWGGLESVSGYFRSTRCGVAGEGAMVKQKEKVPPPRGPTGASHIPHTYIYLAIEILLTSSIL